MTQPLTEWSEEAVFDRLRTIVADVLVLDEEEVERTSKLVDDLDADSIAFLELTWRIRRDFGVPVPEVKVDEETLTMPMLEGLERIGAQAGGVTLFEFVKDGASADRRDSAFAARAASTLRRLVERPEFRERLRAALATAADDPAMARALRALLHEAGSNDEFRRALDTTLADDRALADAVADLQARGDGETRTADVLPLWARLLAHGDSARALFGLRVEDLGALLGSGVPEGLDPAADVGSLILRDLFRFVTVDAYVHYILFLHETADAAA